VSKQFLADARPCWVPVCFRSSLDSGEGKQPNTARLQEFPYV
jgi:hypothetical protein